MNRNEYESAMEALANGYGATGAGMQRAIDKIMPGHPPLMSLELHEGSSINNDVIDSAIFELWQRWVAFRDGDTRRLCVLGYARCKLFEVNKK